MKRLKSKKNNSKKKIIILITLLAILISIATYIILGFHRHDIAPIDSEALYGGEIENNLYPYAGYLVSYKKNGSANLCGTTYLSNKIAISAAHCFRDTAYTQIGYSLFKLNSNKNFLANDVTIKPEYIKKEEVSNDFAVIQLPDNFSEILEFAKVSTPEIGCDYEVLGYGRNEDDSLQGTFQSLRKKAEVCIIEIDPSTFTFKGVNGGICIGDSGSAIFKKDTNEIVGIVSSIIADKSEIDNPCSIGNTAIAVRPDSNNTFISQVENNTFDKSQIALCGDPCINKQCSFGLICSSENKCIGLSGSCISESGNFCFEEANLQCVSGNTCLENICKTEFEGNMRKLIETNLGINIPPEINLQPFRIILIVFFVILALITIKESLLKH